MNLNLPPSPIPDRVSITGALPANQRTTYAELNGPGSIQHIWVVLTRPERRSGRQQIGEDNLTGATLDVSCASAYTTTVGNRLENFLLEHPPENGS